MIYIAIDPGINGAIAIKKNGGITVQKCPASVIEMADMLKDNQNESKAVIEKVGAMPGNGVASMFAFGENYGQWQGVLAALGIPFIEVSPQKWQKTVPNMPTPRKTKGEKKTAAQKAAEKTERKKHILDYVQKRTGGKIYLYAADAVAMVLASEIIWGDYNDKQNI